LGRLPFEIRPPPPNCRPGLPGGAWLLRRPSASRGAPSGDRAGCLKALSPGARVGRYGGEGAGAVGRPWGCRRGAAGLVSLFT